MTTKASKHGLRKAAQERSNRHAQRTPLPPRPGQVEAAREPVADLLGLDTLSVVQQATEAASSNESPVDGKSLGKAQAFAAKAEAAGWTVAMGMVAGGHEVTATRGPETIVQAWRNGVWEWPTSFYAHGDRNTKPRNASGAAKLLLRSEEDAAKEAGKVAANKHFRKSEPKDIELKLEEAQRNLPWDPETAPDELILAALTGQAVVWYNRLSRGQESAIVGRRGVRMSLSSDGERIVTFCCPATGYRSCRVSAILRVGRGRSSVTAGSPTHGVTVEVA